MFGGMLPLQHMAASVSIGGQELAPPPLGGAVTPSDVGGEIFDVDQPRPVGSELVQGRPR